MTPTPLPGTGPVPTGLGCPASEGGACAADWAEPRLKIPLPTPMTPGAAPSRPTGAAALPPLSMALVTAPTLVPCRLLLPATPEAAAWA